MFATPCIVDPAEGLRDNHAAVRLVPLCTLPHHIHRTASHQVCYSLQDQHGWSESGS